MEESMENDMSANIDTVRVFVYGTLKPGEVNYVRYCERYVIRQLQAIAYGHLFDLPLGYPAMTPGNRPVHGSILCFNTPDILRVLDELEDYAPGRPSHENEYDRLTIEVYDPSKMPLGSAWAYLMEYHRAIALGGVPIPDGYWSRLRSS